MTTSAKRRGAGCPVRPVGNACSPDAAERNPGKPINRSRVTLRFTRATNDGRTKHQRRKRRHEEDEERRNKRKGEKLALSADRWEDQGTRRLARRDARPGPQAHQRSLPRRSRGVEVARGPG